MFRFTIREIIMLTTIVALAVMIISEKLSPQESAIRRLKEETQHATDIYRHYEAALRRDRYTVIRGHIVRVGPDGRVIKDNPLPPSEESP